MIEETVALLFAFVLMVLVSSTNEKPRRPDFAVKGKVTDAATGRPISGVLVLDEPSDSVPIQGAVTDRNGAYHYRTWAQAHAISVRSPGYLVARKTIGAETSSGESGLEINFALVTYQDARNRKSIRHTVGLLARLQALHDRSRSWENPNVSRASTTRRGTPETPILQTRSLPRNS